MTINANNSVVINDSLIGFFDILYYRGTKNIMYNYNYGYAVGGRNVPLNTNYSTIDRIPFSDATVNATTIGNLSIAKTASSSSSSETHGYAAGGAAPGNSYTSNFERFPFASVSNGSVVGGLVNAKYINTGHSSLTHGYSAGGYPTPSFTMYSDIDRWPFASASVNASAVGNLTDGIRNMGGASSLENAYTLGGGYTNAGPEISSIHRWPFASASVNATVVANLTSTRTDPTGVSSLRYSAGYSVSGLSATTAIERFGFATTTNSVSVGNLTAYIFSAAGINSDEYGYTAGGEGAGGAISSILRFPFAAAGPTTSSSVGSLTAGVAKRSVGGCQY
jgi:hypothetical protein